MAAGDQIAAEAKLLNLESGRAVRVLKSSYPAGSTATIAKALIGTVTVGLNLKSRAPRETVSDADYAHYTQGLNTLRQDVRKADEAVPFLQRAVALDAGSALPYAALARYEMQKFINGDGREWLDKAGEAAARATAIN